MKFSRLLVCNLLVGTTAFAGGHVTNGGNLIKEYFYESVLLMQNSLLPKVELLSLGVNKTNDSLAETYKIPMNLIPLAIDERNIEVRKGPLFDTNHFKVDSLVESETVFPQVKKIILDQDIWAERVQSRINLDTLVCHELMRSLDVNDDQFQVCFQIIKRMSLNSNRPTKLSGIWIPANDQDISHALVSMVSQMLYVGNPLPADCSITDYQPSKDRSVFVRGPEIFLRQGVKSISLDDFRAANRDFMADTASNTIVLTKEVVRPGESYRIVRMNLPEDLKNQGRALNLFLKFRIESEQIIELTIDESFKSQDARHVNAYIKCK